MKSSPIAVVAASAAIGLAPSAARAQRSAPFPEPPRAAVRPHRLEIHGHMRVDEYFWLNRRDDPEVMRYLEAENAYTDTLMAHTRALQDSLFEEIRGRLREDDRSVPYREDGYYYYTRFEPGKEYPLYCRKKGSLERSEELLLDVNVLAAGYGFFQVSGVQVSSGGNILVFFNDTATPEIYTIRFRDLTTG